MASKTLQLKDEAATRKLAEGLAKQVKSGFKLYLSGQLGAGKTTLSRYLLRSLGVTETIKSPSYTLVERYEVDSFSMLHIDCYRLGDAEELYYLGLSDDWDESLLLVEWPEKAEGFLPPADLNLTLVLKGTSRSCFLEAHSAAGCEVLRHI